MTNPRFPVSALGNDRRVFGKMLGEQEMNEPRSTSGAVTRTFPSHPSAVVEVRRFVRERAAETSFYQRAADELVLAVSEAASNSALHSNSEEFVVEWRELMGGAEVVVRDQGVFGPPRRMLTEVVHHGWGFSLMAGMVDSLSVERGTARSPGTWVRLFKLRR